MKQSRPMCPSHAELSQLLEPQAGLDDNLSEHLDHCAACRQTLDGLAGDATWWESASKILSEPAPAHNWASSICALSATAPTARTDDPLCEHELQQLQTLLEPASHPELIGRLGRYELEQLVGRGGMGLVFRARDVELHRVVAVKALAIHLVPFGAARDRFVREARATASLTHPHIVPVYDVITDGAVPAIVMQYIAGPTLEQQLCEVGPLPWQDVIQIGIQLADALSVAHQRELVHRDIKPGNVLLEAGGSRALLTDFGLVRALDDATLTRSGALAGTPDYMSPEQARGETLNHSSDLFSLGSLFYAMLTGHPPFRAENPMAVMHRICQHRPRQLRDVRADCPIELTQLVERLLAKAPRKRYPSAESVAERLRALAIAPSRLRPCVKRRRRVMVAIASLTLAACALIALVNYSVFLPADSTKQRRQGTLGRPSETVHRETNSSVGVNDGNATRRKPHSDLVELQRLDQDLARLKSIAKELLDRSREPTVDELMNMPTGFESLDRDVTRLKTDLNRLEAEMRN
ncbi:MAG: serine/threonine-protein kinase [Pirellulaceae bacterium]